MRRQTETISAGLSFPCKCKGCRGLTADLESVWHVGQIAGKVQGYYFSEGARRFFHSRVLAFRHLADGALAVRESQAGDMDNLTRAHRVTVWCRYGIVQNYDTSQNNYSTGTKADKVMRGLPDTAANGCQCHGCQLDAVKATREAGR